MGKVKAQLIEALDRDIVMRFFAEIEEDGRREPVLPDPVIVTDGQDARCQEGGSVSYPFIFKKRSVLPRVYAVTLNES
jgi:hypothetical protein